MEIIKKYPFKFLDAYGKEDKDIFFGREEEVDELYRLVFQTNLLLVYGASGTGKTSLIRCGLANRFKPSQWLDLYIRRGADINQSLLATIRNHTPRTAAVSEEPGELDWFESMLEAEKAAGTPEAESPVLDTGNPIAQALHALYLATFTPIYLIFDQFEELYTLGQEPEQLELIRTIAELVQLPLPLKIIVVMREEYLANLYELEKAVPQLRNKKLRIEPMDLPRVEAVILNATARNPHSNVELEVGRETAIAKSIIEKIREKDVNIKLPYLQVFMDRLYESATGEATDRSLATRLTLDLVTGMGDIGDVLADFIERQSRRIYQQLTQQLIDREEAEDISGRSRRTDKRLSQQYQDLPTDIVWRILSPFATVDGTKAPIRLEALPDLLRDLDLPPAVPAGELIKTAISELEASRILRYRKEEGTYEVMHDVLARQIHAHRSDEEIALLEVRRLIRSQTAIKAEAREFFTEKQLNFMEPVLPRLQLTPEEEDWIARSRAQVQAQKEVEERRRQEELETARKNAEQESCLRAEADVARREAEQNAAQAAENAKRAVANAHRAKRRTHVAWLISILALALMGLAFWQYRVAEKQKITLIDTNRQLDEQTAEAIAARDEARRNERFALQRDSIAQLRTLEALSSDSIAKERAADAVTALSSLKITAAQAVGLLLEAADRNILQLEYDAALKKCQGALNLGERKEDTYRRLREIAFFFTESGRYGGADSTLQLILGRQTDRKRNTLLSTLQKLAPLHYDSLQNRYYPEMVDVPGGTFLMGCDTTQECSEVAYPPHWVRLDTYRIARTETTVWQYYLYVKAKKGKRKMPDKPCWGWWGNNPIVNVSWYDALGYANWLSEQRHFDKVYLDSIPENPNNLYVREIQVDWSANGYRLPTEAEWEYAARGGPDWKDNLLYAGSNDLDSVAWWEGNAYSRSHTVKAKKANQLGLYDMSGNAMEWCWDWYERDYYKDKQFTEEEVFHPTGPDILISPVDPHFRVIRGGCYRFRAWSALSWNRDFGSASGADYKYCGFRLVQD